MPMKFPPKIGTRAVQAFSLAGLATAVLKRTATRRFPDLSVTERLAMVPSSAPIHAQVTIHWNDQHIPFVVADNDRDAAVGLGIVHGHLRLAQVELMRRAATGRLAEIGGPAAVTVDRLLRLIDFPRVTDQSLAMMPDVTRRWVDGFADGLTAAADCAPLPPEFAVFEVEPEPWTAAEVFAVSRLCSADYAWKVWRTLNKLRGEPDWADLWADLIGVSAVADEDIPVGADNLDEALPTVFARTGSNAYAVAGSRTRSGKPMLACDPHHIIAAPGLWLIAGVASETARVWGLMIPGLPVFAPGRNPHGAWGGTNLHATSSELVDVTGEALEERSSQIAVRGRETATVTLRESKFGPVVSDAKPFEMPADTVALHWLGHRPSDEFSPFYDLMRARHWVDFEAAIDAYGLPGLNMLWAGNDGTIGKMIAAKVPRRPLALPGDIVVKPEDAHAQWAELVSARDLPVDKDPDDGVIVSANEAPDTSPVTISLFFAADFRAKRIRSVLTASDDLTPSDLMDLQHDVYLMPAHALSRHLVGVAKAIPLSAPIIDAIDGWDGHYRADSRGALAFELIAAPLIEALEARSPKKVVAPYWRPFTRLTRLVEAAAPEDLSAALTKAVDAARKPFERYSAWGAIHRMRLCHPLARLPWLAARLPTITYGASGSNDTVMKSMHPFTQEPHVTNFGANARFVADLSGPDETWAVLLGGQDGWPGSRSMFDQVGPWRRGEPIRLPLSEEALAEAFPHVTAVRPAP